MANRTLHIVLLQMHNALTYFVILIIILPIMCLFISEHLITAAHCGHDKLSLILWPLGETGKAYSLQPDILSEKPVFLILHRNEFRSQKPARLPFLLVKMPSG